MPDLALTDVSLHYEVSGDGPPLLLIAGFMSDSASWGPLLPLLEPHFTCIRPDNRTCGRTAPWDAPVGMDEWVGDLIALLDHLDHTKAHVVGHSLGGIIGWVLGVTAPERVASLMMLGAAPIPTHRNELLFQSLIDIRRSDAPPETWLNVLFPWLFRKEAFAAPEAIKEAAAASLAYPYAQSADAMELQMKARHTIKAALFKTPPPVPCHAILSPDDLLVPIDDARPSLHDIPLLELPGLGHSLHWDDPERVATEVRTLANSNPI